jgi:hypothetical protein
MRRMKLPDEIREFFRKQGKIGAAKRHSGMTPERRSEVAKLAAEIRWANAKNDPEKTRKSKKAGGTK